MPELLPSLDRLAEKIDGKVEVIFVDDGSKDGSAAYIAKAMQNDRHIKLIRLSRNFGHQIAVTAGLDAAVGHAVIIMDADLQDPPEVVLELIAKWKDGFDIVHAQRNRREGETLFKKASAKAFYRILNRITSTDIPQDVGDFRLVDAKVVDALRAMPERDRFLRGLFSWVGFKQTIVHYDRHERFAGKTKYTMLKMLKLATDGIVGFSDAPLRLALWFGVLVSIAALFYGGYVVLSALRSDELVPGWASTIVVLSFLSGVNLLISGIIGLYVGRIYTEVKQRPLYLIEENIGLSAANLEHINRRADYATK